MPNDQVSGNYELVVALIAPDTETGADTFPFHGAWPANKCVGASSNLTMIQVHGLSAA